MINRNETSAGPVIKTRVVPLTVEQAFDLFTARMGEWWPLPSHSIAHDDATGVRFEGRAGGQIVELTSSGDEHPWGEVLEWAPPHRFVASWQLPNPEEATTLEVRFRSVESGTEIVLEHSGWERLGAPGIERRGNYLEGWDFVLGHFETLAGA